MPAGFIEYELDEVYPFLIRQPNHKYGAVVGHLDIPVSGAATIAYNDDEGDWFLSTLDISATGKKGDDFTERHEDGFIFKAVEDYLATKKADIIAEKIHDDLENQRESYLADRAA